MKFFEGVISDLENMTCLTCQEYYGFHIKCRKMKEPERDFCSNYTKMDQNYLTPKKCPFCGGEAYWTVGDFSVKQPDLVMCGTCDVVIEGTYEARSALVQWNKRR